MSKTLTAFVVSLFIVGTASAQWHNEISHDEWDGARTTSNVYAFRNEFDMVFGLTRQGNVQLALLGLIPVSAKGLCLGNDIYIRAKFDGVEVEANYSEITVSDTNNVTAFELSSPINWSENARKHDELKIRLVDDCGQKFDATFDIRGVPEVKFD